MKESQYDQSFDFTVAWDQYQNDDWISPGIELEANEIPNPPAYAPSRDQKGRSLEYQVADTKTGMSTSTQSNTVAHCCAFRKLDDVLKNPTDAHDNLSRKGPCHKLITWVATCRDEDPALDRGVKRSCPLAKCTFSCDPNNGELIRHILGCSFLKYGKYKCPYHNDIESFMIPPQRRLRKRWNRAHSLKEAFRDICKLGSKGLHKAFGHSSKKRQFDTIDDIDSSGLEIDGLPKVYHKRASNSHMIYTEKRQPPTRRSEALQSRIQSQVREAEDTQLPCELATEFCNELDGQELEIESVVYNELSSVRFSAMPQDLPQIVTNFDAASECDTFLPSPLSPTQYVSNKQFETPISPQDVQSVVRWQEAIESSSGKHASLDAVVFGWPMNQKTSLQPTPQIAGSRSPNARLRAKGFKALCIDTSVGNTRPVAAPASKAQSPISPHEQLPSSPENPEVLSQEPTKFLEELKSTVKNTFTFTYAQLSRPPRLEISEHIISKQLTPAEVFSNGWDAVEMVLKGQLPQKFIYLFSLAHLAFCCGQVVWENKLKYQLGDILEDLRVWSYALRSPRERQHYIEVIEEIFSNEDQKHQDAESSSRRSSFESTRSHRDTLSLDGSELLAKLRNGVVTRLCFSFLNTFEYLQNRIDRIENATANGLASLLETTDSNELNVSVLDTAVIRPLQAVKQFHEFRHAIGKAADLLCDYPSTSSRELELYLSCHARYYTDDYALHGQFRKTVGELCSEAASTLTGLPIDASYHLIQNINTVRDCQRHCSPKTVAPILQEPTIFQELPGSPVVNVFQKPAPPTRPRIEVPQTRPMSRPFSWVQTPISANTPSTATSSRDSSVWTPISANSFTPATTTETTLPSPFISMGWSTLVADDTPYTHPDFPLAINSDYSLLNNDFLQEETLFDTDLELSTDSEQPPAKNKASLSCGICGTTFRGKEQFLSSNLRRHMRELHSSAARGLTCEVCQKQFTRKHNLNVHLKTVHAEGRS